MSDTVKVVVFAIALLVLSALAFFVFREKEGDGTFTERPHAAAGNDVDAPDLVDPDRPKASPSRGGAQRRTTSEKNAAAPTASMPETPTPTIDDAPDAAVSGHVLDADGKVVAGARIQVDDRASKKRVEAVSAEDGSYRLTGLNAGAQDIDVDAHAAGKARVHVVLIEAQEFVQDIVVRNGPTLRGVVIEAGGRAISSAAIVATGRGENAVDVKHATSGPDGRFAIEGCLEVNYRLTCALPESPNSVAAALETAMPGGPLVTLVVPDEMRGSATIEGRVLSAENKTIGGARIVAEKRGDAVPPTTVSDAKTGVFRLPKLAPGEYTLTVAVEGRPERRLGPKTLAKDETWDVGDVKPIDGGAVHVRFRTEDGGPIGDFTAVAHPLGGQSSAAENLDVSGDDSRAATLAPGKWRLVVLSATLAADETTFDVSAGGDTKLDVMLVRGAERRIVITEPEGVEKTEAVALVLKTAAGDVKKSARFGKIVGAIDWTLTLPVGDYVVEVRGDHSRKATANFSVDVNGPPSDRVEIVLR